MLRHISLPYFGRLQFPFFSPSSRSFCATFFPRFCILLFSHIFFLAFAHFRSPFFVYNYISLVPFVARTFLSLFSILRSHFVGA